MLGVAVATGLGLLLGQAQTERSSLTGLSANEKFSVRLTQTGVGQCHLVVKEGDRPVWTQEKCWGGPDDLYLVSNDGKRVWVIYTVPHDAPGKDPLSSVMVAALYDRSGERVKTKAVKDFYRTWDRHRVKRLGHHFKWATGVAGELGARPHVTPKNEVELETLQPRTFHFGF